jgi:hypothetical protein
MSMSLRLILDEHRLLGSWQRLRFFKGAWMRGPYPDSCKVIRPETIFQPLDVMWEAD